MSLALRRLEQARALCRFIFISSVCHVCLLKPDDCRHAGRRFRGNVRRRRPTCHFTSARKLGVGSVPMSACLGNFGDMISISLVREF